MEQLPKDLMQRRNVPQQVPVDSAKEPAILFYDLRLTTYDLRLMTILNRPLNAV